MPQLEPMPPSALKSTIAIMEDGFIGAHPFMEETKDEDEEGDGTWEQMAVLAGTLYVLMAHCRLAAPCCSRCLMPQHPPSCNYRCFEEGVWTT